MGSQESIYDADLSLDLAVKTAGSSHTGVLAVLMVCLGVVTILVLIAWLGCSSWGLRRYSNSHAVYSDVNSVVAISDSDDENSPNANPAAI